MNLRFPDIFNIRKCAELERRIAAIENAIVEIKRQSVDNRRPEPLTLSNPEEGEVWLRKHD
jgi:hypothetical protein